MITAIIRILLYAALGRYRGSKKRWPGSGQLNRILFWGLPVGTDLFIAFNAFDSFGASALLWVALVAAMWAGLAIAEWGQWYDLGHNHDTWESDFLNLIWRGALITGFAGLVLITASLAFGAGDWRDGLIFGLAGVVMAPAYALGWKLPSVASWLNKGPEWGELLTAAFIATVFNLLV